MVKLLKAKKSDIALLARLLKEASVSVGIHWEIGHAKKRLSGIFDSDSSTCFVIKEKKDVVGFAFCRIVYWDNFKVLWVEEMAISKPHQNKGHGTKALHELAKWAKKRKFDWLVLASTKKTHSFYKRSGFKETDYTVMWKKLTKY